MNLLLHLEFFIAVAEEQHFGRAAARLGMTQPPLSQGVKKLERELGVTLFHRGSKGVVLTASGQALLPDAIDLIGQAQRFTDTARRRQAHERTLRVGVMPKVPTALVADLAATVRSFAGSGRVEVSIAPSADLVDQLGSGAIDLGVIEHPALVDPLTGTDVVPLPLTLLVPASHPAAAQDPCGLSRLTGLRFASPPRSDGPAAYDLLGDAFARVGTDLDVINAPDDRWALALVAAGQAFALTADHTLSAPGVGRVRPGDESIRLRLRCLRSASADVPDRVLDAMAARIAGYAAAGQVTS
ncbi:DNA-binding transcriptional LysR family regulator [Rhodococcus sp. AG1013]|uniref:LysR family transcriptional regulator n=1 Tax=Rhodococcus sp. AG1013 TaxID=2183996 RepID=UPI000E0C653F|nr:LysR family transcriptional regulator [Rhodococcus sp. AG1013]RDI26821.1 DNA-binding transcriptional LysR family regulator [Rhodococcus sp. AG1013]